MSRIFSQGAGSWEPLGCSVMGVRFDIIKSIVFLSCLTLLKILLPFHLACKRFSIVNGQLIYKKDRRVIVEKNRQLEIIKDIHEGKAIITLTIIHYQAFIICFNSILSE